MCQNVPKTIQDTGQVTGQENMQVICDITNRKSNGIHKNKHAIVCTQKRCYNDSKYAPHFSNFFLLILHTFPKISRKVNLIFSNFVSLIFGNL